jgi:hypothetical protein
MKFVFSLPEKRMQKTALLNHRQQALQSERTVKTIQLPYGNTQTL